MSGCSRRWSASTRSTTATSSATGTSSPSCPRCGGYARDLFQTPGFGDTVDFDQIKTHYYVVHSGINPTGIVPRGPDLLGWTEPHGRGPSRPTVDAWRVSGERGGGRTARAATTPGLTALDPRTGQRYERDGSEEPSA